MRIRRGESLRRLNTLALDVRAGALVEVRSGEELSEALAWAAAEHLPVLPLGEGSNIVLAGDVDALVLVQRSAGLEVLEETPQAVALRVDAGHDWHRLVQVALDRGLYGLENLALIPGTVGAAPIQNIGAYGVEIAAFVRAVHAVDTRSGESLTLTTSDCGFAYRDSVFKGELRDRVVITAVDISLSREPAVNIAYPALRQELEHEGREHPTPRDVFDAVVRVRRRRLPDPALEPNAGSFFKNPVVDPAQAAELVSAYPGLPQYLQADGRIKLAAAWLIEKDGWKGHRAGAVGVHPGHALVMVNYGGGTGVEILALAERIIDSVRQRFGVCLEMEPRVIGRAP